MERFRAARRLTCFYCGQRSGVPRDGLVRDFVCRHCDATNYLDENGEITDPPVATDREAAVTRYAAPKPPPPPSDAIFCTTCLKNQHLFTKSLAQYFPDDPDDPDYAQLDRNYYRYRRGLEQRYPQVCDDCAHKVDARIRQAGYTAKTDHLRRMMDMTRRPRPAAAKTAVHRVHALARAIWTAGFALQLLCHLAALALVLQHARDGLRDPDVESASAKASRWAARATALLPAPDTLLWWSIGAAIASAWWNPHFVQLNRGFTRHLLGFTQWYCFQGLVIFCRLLFRRLVAVQGGGHGQSKQAQLSAHAAMGVVMGLIYVLSGRSIRVDTSPLFATTSQRTAVREAPSPATRKREATKTLSELFNEALDSSHGSLQRPEERQQAHPPPSFLRSVPPPSITSPTPLTRNLASTLESTASQDPYAEEMDWSPIAPRQHAFGQQLAPSAGGINALGQGPAEAMSSNPFRYKVPAAPLNPARRLRNPPQVPQAHKPLAEPDRLAFGQQNARDGERHMMRSEVEFRQPHFFAPERDDASSLADLLSQSFSLSQDDDEQDANADGGQRVQTPEKLRVGKTRTKALSTKAVAKGKPDAARAWHARLMELSVLGVMLLAWLLTVATTLPRQVECRIVVMAVSGILALRGTGDASAEEEHGSVIAHVLAAWAVAELATICWVTSTLWKGDAAGIGWYGSGVLTTMLVRQAWRSLA